MSGGIFSESWYRIAHQQVSLRNQVHMRRQYFRGEKWFVLEDPFTNQFFRIRPEAREFLVRLGPGRTVEEVWKECLELDPENAPGQEDVIRLLAQLYHANLLQYGLPEDSVKLFERFKKRREKEIRSKLLGVMFMRIPLLDPDEFLKRALKFMGRVFSPAGAAVWLVAVLLAFKVIVDHFGELVDQSQGILSPGNLPLLYLSMVFIKTLHEFGHAFVCRHFGGEVHVMGVMLLIFTPVPYMDATSSWAFRSRWQRVFVGAAGMMVEVFVAALAVFVWANTGAGTINSLAYNIIFIASVSTVLFNINPLLRFDGYYILSDVLDIPSLHSRSSRHLKHLCERYLFGFSKSVSPARSTREAAQLTVFGIFSGIYKIFVFTAIILFVADKFLLAGLIMAILCVVSMGVVPVLRLVHYLLYSPQLERTRVRAITVMASLVLVVWIFLQFIPFRSHFISPGIIKAEHYAEVSSQAAGILVDIVTPSGTMVEAGQVLLRLQDPEIDSLLKLVQAEWDEASARYRRAMKQASADLEPLAVYRDAVQQRLERLKQRKAELEVRAPIYGQWVAPDTADGLKGVWVPRGVSLGSIVENHHYRFSAVIAQSDVSRLFNNEIRIAQVRLRGQAGYDLPVGNMRFIPAERDQLPSAALGWSAGGDIRVVDSDRHGLTAAEPFFEVFAALQPHDKARYFHGASGIIRFSLPAEPLLPRWIRAFRQLLQKRYQY